MQDFVKATGDASKGGVTRALLDLPTLIRATASFQSIHPNENRKSERACCNVYDVNQHGIKADRVRGMSESIVYVQNKRIVEEYCKFLCRDRMFYLGCSTIYQHRF